MRAVRLVHCCDSGHEESWNGTLWNVTKPAPHTKAEFKRDSVRAGYAPEKRLDDE
jgi:hypothetical protein